MVVEAAKPASVKLGEAFSYELTVIPNADQSVNISTLISLNGNTMSPSFTVAYGKEAKVKVGEQAITILVNKTKS